MHEETCFELEESILMRFILYKIKKKIEQGSIKRCHINIFHLVNELISFTLFNLSHLFTRESPQDLEG